VVKVRRDYNALGGQRDLEDYALRYTPQRTGAGRSVAGGQHRLRSGVVPDPGSGGGHAAGAVRPISVYAARYGLDMDLLTRGAGFGYIGSTITSLIYASRSPSSSSRWRRR
jgi:hypothetical protein